MRCLNVLGKLYGRRGTLVAPKANINVEYGRTDYRLGATGLKSTEPSEPQHSGDCVTYAMSAVRSRACGSQGSAELPKCIVGCISVLELQEDFYCS